MKLLRLITLIFVLDLVFAFCVVEFLPSSHSSNKQKCDGFYMLATDGKT